MTEITQADRDYLAEQMADAGLDDLADSIRGDKLVSKAMDVALACVSTLRAERLNARQAEHRTFTDAAKINVENDELRDEVERLTSAKDAAIKLWNGAGEDLKKADDVLRSLSSFVGQGGMWDTEVLNYDEMEARIREGVNTICDVQTKRLDAAQAERDQLRADLAECEEETARYRRDRDEISARNLIIAGERDRLKVALTVIAAMLKRYQPDGTPYHINEAIDTATAALAEGGAS